MTTWRSEEFTAWTLPSFFLIPAAPVDESFETGCTGEGALNAWKLQGVILPRIQSADAADGATSLRFDFRNDSSARDWEPASATLAYDLDRPMLMRYAVKFDCKYAPPCFTGLLSVELSEGTGCSQHESEQEWRHETRLLNRGTGTWKFTELSSVCDNWVLLDDISFEDIPTFTADGFELDAQGKPRFAWGFGGWKAPAILDMGGIGNSRCASIPERHEAYNESRTSHVSLVADPGIGASTLPLKAKYGFDCIELYIDGEKAGSHTMAADPLHSGWFDYNFSIPTGGIHLVEIVNATTATKISVDDVVLTK